MISVPASLEGPDVVQATSRRLLRPGIYWEMQTRAKVSFSILRFSFNTIRSSVDHSESDKLMETGRRLQPWRTSSSSSTTSNVSTTSTTVSDTVASASSNRLSIYLYEPSSSTSNASKEVFISPGSKVSGTVTASSLKDAKALKVSLTGKCETNILGSMGMGPHRIGRGGAAGMPVTYNEMHCFLRWEAVLWTEEQATEHNEFRFSIDVPRLKQCKCRAASYTLPPTGNLKTSTKNAFLMDRSTVDVTYAISATLERKGFLKRDAKCAKTYDNPFIRRRN